MKHEVRSVKVKWIEFENLESGLKIEHIDFFDDISLLVGLSGAGKTQILEAIHYALKLGIGKVNILYPHKACLGISINGHNYKWEYVIKKKSSENDLSFEGANSYFFSYESLFCDNEMIFIRDEDNIKILSYTDVPTPQKDKSLIYQYSDDDYFEEICFALRKLYPIDIDIDVRGGFDSDKFDELKASINTYIRKKQNVDIEFFSHLPSIVKLHTIKRHYQQKYLEMLDMIQDIFSEIEDINVVKDRIRDAYYVEITVYGKKLHQNNISNGMLKTIYYIVELCTASKDSLVIIDEFENGLGMNCIDAVSSLIKEERPDIQFIITSHHPKIINSIDYHSWKIIEREKNVVYNYDSTNKGYNLGGNRHDAYYNLLNKWDFEGKI